MQEEAQSRVQNQMNFLQDALSKLNDNIQLLDKEVKSKATVIQHVSTSSAPIGKNSSGSSDDADSLELQSEVSRLIDIHREQIQSDLCSLEDRLTSISLVILCDYLLYFRIKLYTQYCCLGC
jgi:predicted  nucleic acid-binding Zn-ribbon protein